MSINKNPYQMLLAIAVILFALLQTQVISAKSFSREANNHVPTIILTSPDLSNETIVAGDKYWWIEWHDDDPDDNASISLYYDTDTNSLNGHAGLIVSGLSEDPDGGYDRHIWDTTGIAPGEYWVYALIEDSAGATATSYSPGTLTLNAKPWIRIDDPRENGLHSADDLFFIRWTDVDPDSNATIKLWYAEDRNAVSKTAISQPIIYEDLEGTAGDRYGWNTSAIPNGAYYIYAEITDGNSTFSDWSDGPLLISHGEPLIHVYRPDRLGDTADNEFYIRWNLANNTHPNNTIQLYYAPNHNLASRRAIDHPIIYAHDENYRWNTSNFVNGSSFYIFAELNYRAGNGVPAGTAYDSSEGKLTIDHGSSFSPIVINTPGGNGATADLNYTISWTDTGIEPESTISLYYDNDASGYDGVLINSVPIPAWPDGNEGDEYVWDTSALVEGSFYYVYAVLTDGNGTPTYYDYSAGPVEIVANEPPWIGITSPYVLDHNADDFFFIRWTDHDPDSNATIKLFYADNPEGNNRKPIHHPVIYEDPDTAGDRYGWNTSAIPNGDYYIQAEITDDIDTYTATHYYPLTVFHKPAEIVISEPDGFNDIADNTFKIRWEDISPELGKTISFFYDTDAVGYDGTVIDHPTIFAYPDGGTYDEFDWDTSAIPNGDYYIYAIMEDSQGDVTAYSSGPVTIDHQVIPSGPAITINQPDGVNDTISQTFIIRWTDFNTQHGYKLSLYYDNNASGYDGTLIVSDLDAHADGTADEFDWDVSAFADNSTYYVYAKMTDSSGTESYYDYSSGPVIISHEQSSGKTENEFSGLGKAVTPLASDSDRLGLSSKAPYVNINEYTGKVSAALPMIGPESFGLGLKYKSPNRIDTLFNENYIYNNSFDQSSVGIGWRLDYGFIFARYGHAGSNNGWEQVARVDSAGNLVHFTRDQLFQNPPAGTPGQPTAIDGDGCDASGCYPLLNDMHFIDNQLNRITRDAASFSDRTYYLLEPSGRKTRYRAERHISSPTMGNVLRFYPNRIEEPNGDFINIHYVHSLGETPEGEHPRIDYVSDRYGRKIQFYYDAHGILEGIHHVTRLVLQASGETDVPLMSFTYAVKTHPSHGDASVHLTSMSTPLNYQTIFAVDYYSDAGMLYSSWGFPMLKKLTLPSGGIVALDYEQLAIQRMVDTGLPSAPSVTSDSVIARAVECDNGELETENWLRVKTLSHSGGQYTFNYQQLPLHNLYYGLLETTVNGPENYQRKTQYLNHSLNANYYCDQDNDLLGYPLNSEESYNGSTKREEWLYTSEFPLDNGVGITAHFGMVGGTSIDGPLRIPLVTRYRIKQDNVWTTTTYEYKGIKFGEHVATEEKKRQYLTSANRIIKYAGDLPVSGIPDTAIKQEFDYLHRWSATGDNTPFGPTQLAHHVPYAAGLTSFARMSFKNNGGQEQILNQWETFYDESQPYLQRLPLPVLTKQYRSNSQAIETHMEYYGPGSIYHGLLKSTFVGPISKKVEREVKFLTYQYGTASRIQYPHGLDETKKINLRGQIKESVKDGVVMVYGYDADGRKVSEIPIAITEREPMIIDYGFENGLQTIIQRSASECKNYSMLDEWGRVIFKRSFIENGNSAVNDCELSSDHSSAYAHIKYSPIGLERSATTDSCATANINDCGRTIMTYDVFGRELEKSAFDVSGNLLRKITHSYSRPNASTSKVIVTQQEASLNVVEKITEADLLGRVTYAAMGSSMSSNHRGTGFEYKADPDSDGILHTISPDGGVSRSKVHNWLGQISKETYPEISGDVHYQYDDRGLLEHITGPIYHYGFHYDKLGRLVQKQCENIPLATGEIVCENYHYDALNRLVLTEVKNTSNNQDWIKEHFKSFDAMNMPQEVVLEIGFNGAGQAQQSFTTRYGYDLLGRVESIAYPQLTTSESTANEAIYTYTLNNQQNSIKWQNTNGVYTIAEADFSHQGVSSLNYSNQLNTKSASASWLYDELGRLSSASLLLDHGSTRGSSSSLSDYAIANILYNSHGSIDSYSRNDGLYKTGETFSFDYSETNELLSMAVGNSTASHMNVSYTYDTQGNLTNRSALNTGILTIPSLSAQYSGHNHHTAWVYNAEGMLQRDNQYEYFYDNRGRIDLIWPLGGSASDTRYLYNAGGDRVVTINGNETSYSLRSAGKTISEVTVNTDGSQSRKDFLLLNGGLLMTMDSFQGNTAYYLDRMGSPALTWTNTQSQHIEYSPYGLPMLNSATTNSGPGGYTGHEDDHTGLIYMKARYQHPSYARFLSPDLGRDFNPHKPNTYNLYHYVENNPINAKDPDGLQTEKVKPPKIDENTVVIVADQGTEYWIDKSKKVKKYYEKLGATVIYKPKSFRDAALKIAAVAEKRGKKFSNLRVDGHQTSGDNAVGVVLNKTAMTLEGDEWKTQTFSDTAMRNDPQSTQLIANSIESTGSACYSACFLATYGGKRLVYQANALNLNIIVTTAENLMGNDNVGDDEAWYIFRRDE